MVQAISLLFYILCLRCCLRETFHTIVTRIKEKELHAPTEFQTFVWIVRWSCDLQSTWSVIKTKKWACIVIKRSAKILHKKDKYSGPSFKDSHKFPLIELFSSPLWRYKLTVGTCNPQGNWFYIFSHFPTRQPLCLQAYTCRHMNKHIFVRKKTIYVSRTQEGNMKIKAKETWQQ